MTERKVLNKYFPPDYDPSKIPRLRKGDKRRQFNIRTMAPFNMRCTTCNGYIYKAKKFNSRMETAENVDYLGLRHYRFYIRCPLCCAEIIWRTDLESGDYVLEAGAKRNFEALKTAEELEAKRQAEEEEELANNPMKLLEKRTDQSKQEMEMVEVIEDLKQLNQRQAGMEADHVLLRQLWQESEAQKKAEEESDEAMIKELLASRSKSNECVEEVLRVVPPQPMLPKSSDSVDTPSNTGYSVKTSLHKRPSSSTTTYLKRQLQGSVVLSKKDVPQPSQPGPSAQPATCVSPLSVNHENAGPTSAKVSRLETVAKDAVAVQPQNKVASLLGITYSDHSDSE